ncbi:MAG: amino-acid N-acetyltransferase, partial [Gammaproteobacteria bacterium]
GLAVNPQQTLAMVAQNKCDDFLKTTIYESVAACQEGVKRIHIVPKMMDGALLAELFTRDGIGLMVTNEAYDRIEQATIDDITSLLELIRPLEKEGILVRRSRELLEIEIDHFSLLKRDNTVIGCAALYPYPKESMAELGCLVVNPDYQRNGLADKLLQYIEDQAHEKGINKLFCLTTQASHWFMEHGFKAADLTELPEKKQAFYNFSRNSQPYLKQL